MTISFSFPGRGRNAILRYNSPFSCENSPITIGEDRSLQTSDWTEKDNNGDRTACEILRCSPTKRQASRNKTVIVLGPGKVTVGFLSTVFKFPFKRHKMSSPQREMAS